MQERSDTLSTASLSSVNSWSARSTNDPAAASGIQQFFDSDQIAMLPYTAQSVRLFAELCVRTTESKHSTRCTSPSQQLPEWISSSHMIVASTSWPSQPALHRRQETDIF